MSNAPEINSRFPGCAKALCTDTNNYTLVRARPPRAAISTFSRPMRCPHSSCAPESVALTDRSLAHCVRAWRQQLDCVAQTFPEGSDFAKRASLFATVFLIGQSSFSVSLLLVGCRADLWLYVVWRLAESSCGRALTLELCTVNTTDFCFFEGSDNGEN